MRMARHGGSRSHHRTGAITQVVASVFFIEGRRDRICLSVVLASIACVMTDLTPPSILLRTGERIPLSVLLFSTSRSGGPGGQNVNKVETRVEARLPIPELSMISEETRTRLLERLASKLDAEGVLRVVSATERTQLGNRRKVVERMERVLNDALRVQRKRIATKPSAGSQQRRLEQKKQASQRKQQRRWRGDE